MVIRGKVVGTAEPVTVEVEGGDDFGGGRRACTGAGAGGRRRLDFAGNLRCAGQRAQAGSATALRT